MFGTRALWSWLTGRAGGGSPPRAPAGPRTQPSDVVRVLVVEGCGKAFARTLDILSAAEGSHYKVDWVAGASAAREQIRRAEHDLYLIDAGLGMPEALELLRFGAGRDQHPPMILLTDGPGREQARAALAAGATAYLLKEQASSAALERAIRSTLAERASRAARTADEEQPGAVGEDRRA